MYRLLLAALIVSGVTTADTLNERMTDIQNATLAARLVGTPYVVNETPSIHMGDVKYWVADGDVVRENTATLVILDYNGGSEAAYWLRRLPDVLEPTPAAPTYINDRTTPFTAAQIESFCNTVWQDLNSGAGDIIEFNVTEVDGKTVRVSGNFDIGTDTREARSYYIQLVDPNGSVTVGNANIKFERITE